MKAIKLFAMALFYKFQNLILYGIIGSFAAGMDFLIFYTLSNILGIYYLVANIVSVSVGITISFILNKNYNFKVKDKVLKRFLIFISVGFSGLLLSSVLLYSFINFILLDKSIAKILSIVLIALMQFIMNKYVTFKRKVSETTPIQEVR